MHTIFLNSMNSKTSDPHRLLLNLTDKVNIKRPKHVLYREKYEKSHAKIINLKYHLQHGMKSLIYT